MTPGQSTVIHNGAGSRRSQRADARPLRCGVSEGVRLADGSSPRILLWRWHRTPVRALPRLVSWRTRRIPQQRRLDESCRKHGRLAWPGSPPDTDPRWSALDPGAAAGNSLSRQRLSCGRRRHLRRKPRCLGGSALPIPGLRQDLSQPQIGRAIGRIDAVRSAQPANDLHGVGVEVQRDSNPGGLAACVWPSQKQGQGQRRRCTCASHAFARGTFPTMAGLRHTHPGEQLATLTTICAVRYLRDQAIAERVSQIDPHQSKVQTWII